MRFVPFKQGHSPKGAVPDTARQRILYVEDEDINYEVTQRELEERFELVRARTAGEAFTLLRSQSFDLILMDIQLSRSALDGLTAARILKAREPEAKHPAYTHGVRALHTPIVFVTAYTARYSREELLAAGGDELIAKPVNFVRLSLVMTRSFLRGAAQA